MGKQALCAPVEHAESSGNEPAITRSDGERVVTLEGGRSLAVSPLVPSNGLLSVLLTPLFLASPMAPSPACGLRRAAEHGPGP